MFAELKKLKDIPMITEETKDSMVQDVKAGIGLAGFNNKYPEYRLDKRQFDYFLLRIRRGDRI